MEKKLMGQVLHANARGNASTTRKEIRNIQESIAKAAVRFKSSNGESQQIQKIFL